MHLPVHLGFVYAFFNHFSEKNHILKCCIQLIFVLYMFSGCEPQWGPYPFKEPIGQQRASQPSLPGRLTSDPARKGQVTQTGLPILTKA